MIHNTLHDQWRELQPEQLRMNRLEEIWGMANYILREYSYCFSKKQHAEFWTCNDLVDAEGCKSLANGNRFEPTLDADQFIEIDILTILKADKQI